MERVAKIITDNGYVRKESWTFVKHDKNCTFKITFVDKGENNLVYLDFTKTFRNGIEHILKRDEPRRISRLVNRQMQEVIDARDTDWLKLMGCVSVEYAYKHDGLGINDPLFDEPVHEFERMLT